MNLNDQELTIDAGSHYRIPRTRISQKKFFSELFIQFISNKSYLAQTNKKSGSYS